MKIGQKKTAEGVDDFGEQKRRVPGDRHNRARQGSREGVHAGKQRRQGQQVSTSTTNFQRRGLLWGKPFFYLLKLTLFF